MNPVLKMTLGSLALLAAAHLTPALEGAAQAAKGGRTGSGGGSLVCRDDAGNITYAGLYDLWEYRQLQIARSEAPVAEQVERLLQRLEIINPYFTQKLRAEITGIQSRIAEQLQSGELADAYLVEVNDSLHLFMPSRCPDDSSPSRPVYEQVANYTGMDVLFVTPEIYQKLSSTDKAALILHEGIYKRLREERSVSDSRGTRKAVGYLASSLPISDITAAIEEVIGSPAKNAVSMLTEELRRAALAGTDADIRAAYASRISINGSVYEPETKDLEFWLTRRLNQQFRDAVESLDLRTVREALARSFSVGGKDYTPDVNEGLFDGYPAAFHLSRELRFGEKHEAVAIALEVFRHPSFDPNVALGLASSDNTHPLLHEVLSSKNLELITAILDVPGVDVNVCSYMNWSYVNRDGGKYLLATSALDHAPTRQIRKLLASKGAKKTEAVCPPRRNPGHKGD